MSPRRKILISGEETFPIKAMWLLAEENTMLESVTSAGARFGGKAYALRRVSLVCQRDRLPGKPKATNSGSG